MWEAKVVAAAAAVAAETNWKHKVTPDRGDLNMRCDGLMQKRSHCIANSLKLHLFHIKSSMYPALQTVCFFLLLLYWCHAVGVYFIVESIPAPHNTQLSHNVRPANHRYRPTDMLLLQITLGKAWVVCTLSFTRSWLFSYQVNKSACCWQVTATHLQPLHC